MLSLSNKQEPTNTPSAFPCSLFATTNISMEFAQSITSLAMGLHWWRGYALLPLLLVSQSLRLGGRSSSMSSLNARWKWSKPGYFKFNNAQFKNVILIWVFSHFRRLSLVCLLCFQCAIWAFADLSWLGLEQAKQERGGGRGERVQCQKYTAGFRAHFHNHNR